jgi:small subunit ribosomal protein S17
MQVIRSSLRLGSSFLGNTGATAALNRQLYGCFLNSSYSLFGTRAFSYSVASTSSSPSSSSSSSSSSLGAELNDYKSEIDDVEAEYRHRKERRQALVGTVISNKAAKSITVKVPRPKYIKKYDTTIIFDKMFMAHDDNEECGPGDVVRIVPCRPMSRRKRHKLIDVIKKGVDLSSISTDNA